MDLFWEHIIEPMLQNLQPQSIIEIGTDQGKSTQKLAEYCQKFNKQLHIIDPNPKYNPKVWKDKYGDAIEFHIGLSLNMIPLINEYELVLIDGDHNWYTVYNELNLIEKRAIEQQRPFPTVILHDIGWPYGRRDLYYDPNNIPDAYRQPYKKQGINIDFPELQENGGFNEHLYNSIYENNLRNGVLTAIEDFLTDTKQRLNFYKITGFHGLGIVVDKNIINNSEPLEKFLESLNYSEIIQQHIEKIEKERIKLKLEKQNYKIQLKIKEKSLEKEQQKKETDKSRLEKALKETQNKLQEYKKQVTNQVEQEELLQSYKIAQSNIDKLLTWIEQLDDLIEAMLSSNRWKIGNFLYEIYRRTLRKPLDTPPELLHNQIKKSIESWQQRKSNSRSFQPSIPLKINQQKSSDKLLRLDKESFSIDIIICVHNALFEVKSCLESIIKTTQEWNYTLYIVNDGSEEETSDYLKKWLLDKPNCKLLENETAQGYTKAANKALKETTSDYVVLLNSDTIVPKKWLETLIQCSESDSKIGIVSPLSNAASWQSIPEITQNNTWAINDLPSGYTVDDMAELVRLVSQYQFPRVPFLNGFCLCIKRIVIDQIGYLDEEAFPQGYGEENDYCLRALNAGFELVIADNAYIYHAKSKSYGNERRLKLAKAGSKALAEKHGQEKIDQYLKKMKETTALKEIRARVKEGLANNLVANSKLNNRKPSILFLLPVKGGGGGCHSVVQEAQGMNKLGIKVRIAIPSKYRFNYLDNYPFIEKKKIYFIFMKIRKH
ncbi:glycosyltransferase [Dactylococcopsis salina]|uniref:glycosyltransferase n=1 Tax=Dactylococcopsis salina TaxID=292566 RepID=UPI0002F6389A|nr:glycosyltransferase [Dactylococcopsis salina]